MKTVLIVDDSEAARQLLAQAVQQAGHRSIIAADGDEALEKAAETPPDLVLLDIVMPKRDGYSTCRELRKRVVPHRPKIVFVSVKSSATSQFWAKEQGGDDYVVKPFDAENLVKVIQRNLPS